MTGTPHLLIVDDDDDVARVFARAMEREGYAVTRVRDGAEAIVVCEGSETLAAAIVDVVLPRKGGIEVVRAVRARHPACRVVVVTGVREPAMEQAVLQAGADVFAVKPVELPDLVKAVKG